MSERIIVYRVVCEWDWGFVDQLFETPELAFGESRKMFDEHCYDEEFPEDDFENCCKQGLIEVEEVEVMLTTPSTSTFFKAGSPEHLGDLFDKLNDLLESKL